MPNGPFANGMNGSIILLHTAMSELHHAITSTNLNCISPALYAQILQTVGEAENTDDT